MKRRLFITIATGIFIALLAAIAIPNFIGARTTSAQNACVNNLRQLDGAKIQWALENHKTTNDIPTFADVAPYMKLPLMCPQGGTYTVGRVDESPKGSFGGTHVLPGYSP
jgi:hypothetical protein